MKKRSHGRKTIRNRSKTGAGELTVSTGMTLWEYRQRPGRAYNGRPPQFQSSSAVGLNTSGALSGLRASSFPNPPMGPPKSHKDGNFWIPLKYGDVLSAPYYSTKVGALT